MNKQQARTHNAKVRKQVKKSMDEARGYRLVTPHEVNTLLFDLMGVPRNQQKKYRKENSLA
jgi:hypothetical protein